MTENTPSLVEVIERALQHCGVEMTDSRTSVVAKRIERALLAANLVGEGWQTMDTAPRDGSARDNTKASLLICSLIRTALFSRHLVSGSDAPDFDNSGASFILRDLKGETFKVRVTRLKP